MIRLPGNKMHSWNVPAARSVSTKLNVASDRSSFNSGAVVELSTSSAMLLLHFALDVTAYTPICHSKCSNSKVRWCLNVCSSESVQVCVQVNES